MKGFVIGAILAVLIVITILHDISICRLGRKVDMLQTFLDLTMRQLEKHALGHKSNAGQHVQRVEYVESDGRSRCRKCKHFKREYETPISSGGSYYTYVVCMASECRYEPKDEPQSGYCNECKWYGDKQVCGRCRSRNLYALKDEPQTERSGE